MENTEKKVVSRSEIVQFLTEYFRGRAIASLVAGTVLNVSFAICAALSENQILVMLGSAMAFACFFVFGFMAVRAFLNLRKTKNLDFFITTDQCTNKKVTEEDELSVEKRYLFFRDHKRYYINFQHRGIYAAHGDAFNLYDSVNVGDPCYIVGFEKDRNAYMVLPQKQYSISEGEFEAREQAYYPRKDVDADTLLREDLSARKAELSSSEVEAVEYANETIRVAKLKLRTFLICLGIAILLDVAGTFASPVCVVNLIVQLPLLIIPMVKAFSATRKTKVAVDKIDFDCPVYDEVRKAQNSLGGKMLLFLFLAIIIYIANVVIIGVIAT